MELKGYSPYHGWVQGGRLHSKNDQVHALMLASSRMLLPGSRTPKYKIPRTTTALQLLSGHAVSVQTYIIFIVFTSLHTNLTLWWLIILQNPKPDPIKRNATVVIPKGDEKTSILTLPHVPPGAGSLSRFENDGGATLRAFPPLTKTKMGFDMKVGVSLFAMTAMDSPTLSVQSTIVNVRVQNRQPDGSSLNGDMEEKATLAEKLSTLVTTVKVDLDEEVTFPEGGLRAWLVVVGVLLSQMCSFGYTNAYGVYNDYYVRYYLAENYSSGQISWIGSVQLGLVLSSGLVSGRAFDRGYFYHCMIGGSVLLVFCLFMLSITQAGKLYQVFLLQGVGMGIAIGLMYIPGLGIISQYFSKRRSLALGFGTAGSALGGMLHPIMLNKWFHGSLGFHNGVRASAGLNGGLLLISILLMKPRPIPRKTTSTPSALNNFKTFLRDVPYVTTVFGTLCVLMGLYFPIYFVQLNSIKNGINPELAFYTIAILNGSSIFGRVVPNLFIYKLGAFNILIPCTAIAAVLVFCTLAVQNAAGTIIYVILFGFFSGAYVSTMPPAITSLAHSDGEIGSRLGVCFTFTGIGGLLGTPIAGLLLTSNFYWWRPIIFAGVCVSTGVLCFTCARFMKAKEGGTQRV